MLEVGAKLPSVKAKDDEGKTHSLKDFVKNGLVVYFYPKADTPGCTNEATQFRDLYGEFEKAGVPVVGVSRDSVEAQRKFKAKYELPFTLLADTESAICDAFGTIVEKNMYGRKSMGIQRSTFAFGADGKLAKVWRKVSVAGHAAEVLQSLT